MTNLRELIAAALLATAAIPAQAGIVSHSFSGTITKINVGGQNGTPISGLGGVDVGDTFSGSFTYNTADSTTGLSGSPSGGLWFFDPTTTNTVSFNIDGKVFDTPIGSVSGAQTFNDVSSDLSANTDILDVFKGGLNLPAGWSATSSVGDVIFADATGTALPDGSLPTSFNPADWQLGLIWLRFISVTTPTETLNDVYIEGDINMESPTVPEPSGLVLASTAFLIGGWRVRRRKNQLSS